MFISHCKYPMSAINGTFFFRIKCHLKILFNDYSTLSIKVINKLNNGSHKPCKSPREKRVIPT